MLFGDFRKAQNAYIDKVFEIIKYQGDLFVETAQKAEESYNSEFTLMSIIGAISVLIAILMAIFVTRGITKPIGKAVEAAENIAKGNVNVDLETNSKDETGTLINAMKTMAQNIAKLVKEMNRVAHDATEGKLDSRGFDRDFQGEYQNIVRGFNSTLDAVTGPLNVAAEYIDRISKGDIPPKITDEYKGDFNEIKNNLNTCIDAVQLLINDALMLAKAAEDGKLDTRADASRHQGDFRRIVDGVNKTLDYVIEPIKEASEVLAVMATGDLTIRMIGNYKGDLAKLKNDLNMLGDSLSELIRQVNEAVQNTASSAMQISSTAEGLAAATQEQSAQADDVATAVEEMSRTITENAMSANKTAEVAKENGRIAKEGGQVVTLTVNKMRDIAKVVKNSAENIQKLGESSKQIGEIISVIDDIADQTNLLALNAAIEAARAGEQGRGFAVVADEVRKLAERTTEATKQIAVMIKGIQSETEAAVNAMNKGNEEVNSGIELADKAGQSLQQILVSTQEVIDMINQIAAASEEQSATSEEISKNVTSISKVTAESAQHVEEVAHTADDLAKMTNQLAELMRQFKFDDMHSGMPMRQLSRAKAKQLQSRTE
jgi:methyl-accepting chemotaxis protein